jgi:hypothetical protein
MWVLYLQECLLAIVHIRRAGVGVQQVAEGVLGGLNQRLDLNRLALQLGWPLVTPVVQFSRALLSHNPLLKSPLHCVRQF